MPTNAYQLSFPCPECGGMLTMSVKNGEGDCPLCQTAITVNLDVQKVSSLASDNTPQRGWDSRAFRRPATADKPIWQPLHEPAE